MVDPRSPRSPSPIALANLTQALTQSLSQSIPSVLEPQPWPFQTRRPVSRSRLHPRAPSRQLPHSHRLHQLPYCLVIQPHQFPNLLHPHLSLISLVAHIG